MDINAFDEAKNEMIQRHPFGRQQMGACAIDLAARACFTKRCKIAVLEREKEETCHLCRAVGLAQKKLVHGQALELRSSSGQGG